MPSRVQAIAGLNPGAETVLVTVYPSIAATAPGRLLGRLYDSIPLKLGGIKLSHLLFTLPTAPLAVALYALLKLFGRQYVLTNRSVQLRLALSGRRTAQFALAEIAEIEIEQLPGQAFYYAADLVLLRADGEELMRFEGVPRAEVIRQLILEARDARMKTEASMAAIEARHHQPA
jgi:hypothetical protein